MNWNRLFLHDLRRGIFCKRAIIPLLQFFLILSLFLLNTRRNVEQITVGDFIFHLFCGLPLPQSIREDAFHLPTIWLQVLACPVYLNMSYPLSDLTKEGEQILIRSGSRKQWFLSKCVWNLCASIFYFCSALVTALILTLAAGGKLSLTCTPFLVELSSDMPMKSEITSLEEIIALVLLPLLTISALNILQMTLSFFMKPIYSFLICMAILVASVFSTCPILLGNGAMLLRSPLFFSEKTKVSVLLTGITELFVIISCISMGMLKFKTFDVLPSAEKE